MTGPDKKNKNPIILFLLAFVVIVVVTFIANYSSALKKELKSPANGVESLSTIEDSLIAISPQKEIYIWDWKNIDNQPRTGYVKANIVAWLPSERLIWTPSDNPGTIIVSNLKADKEYNRLFAQSGQRCEHISVSRNGRFVALILTDKAEVTRGSDSLGRICLEMISPDLDELSRIVTIDSNDNFVACDFAISDDGTSIAVVGQKNNLGWTAVVDVKQKQLSWQQGPERSTKLTEVAFSPDGRIVYSAGEGREIYGFDTATGRLLSTRQIDEQKLPPNKKLHISCIAISHNGRFLAVGSEPFSIIYVWDIKTGSKPDTIGSGMTILNALAFSPDSSLLAVSGRIADQKVKIWKISG